MFSPEAYHYFPYFAVAHTSALLAIIRENATSTAPVTVKSSGSSWHDWLAGLDRPALDRPFPGVQRT